jgi:hypothetical protein
MSDYVKVYLESYLFEEVAEHEPLLTEFPKRTFVSLHQYSP